MKINQQNQLKSNETMKKLRIILLLTMLLIFGFSRTFAQQEHKTAYQQKIVEITQKYFKVLYGYNKELTVYDRMQLEMMTNGEDASRFILGIGMLGYATKHSEAETKRLIEQIKAELKQADKLKTAVDFKREKDAKDKKEREEKEKKLKEEQEAYEKTDVGSLKKNIKENFEKWNQKNEFEKEADYAVRLQNQSQRAFDSICINQIKRKIDNSYYWKKELSIYNSENESFSVTFKINEVEWQNNINVPIAQAQSFKANWSELQFEIDDYDWCFVEKSLSPTVVKLNNNTDKLEYKFLLSLKNQTGINIPFDNFGIDNSFLKGYVFEYSKAKNNSEQIEKEKIRIDSLTLANFNHKLDSIFTNCNQQLLQNPFNTNKKVMSNFPHITTDLRKDYDDENISETRQRKFNEYKDEISREFNNLYNSFERELESSNPKQFCTIYFAQNPDKKTEADRKYLECRCNYPKREDFDLRFIKRNLYDCNCRANDYDKYGDLFSNKIEFDSFYDQGEAILQEEVNIRQFKKHASLIETLDFKDGVNSTSNGQIGKAILSGLTGINLPSNEQKQELTKYYIQKIDSYKDKQYYAKIIDFFVEINKGLTKEWSKNGTYFTDKTEFYNAYISGNYKQILKEKKNN